MKDKKVSIIIPVYNGADYLKDAINSALNQTYQNREIIIVNDGSTDNGETEKVAKSFGNKIKYYKKENGGVSSALNFGIDKMTGEYFSWLSHDDLYYPEKIEEEINLINKIGNNKCVIFSDFDYIDENSKLLEEVNISNKIKNTDGLFVFYKRLISGISLLIPKELIKKVGMFDEECKYTQDNDMWYKLLQKYEFVYLNKTLVKIRLHSNSTSNSDKNVLKESETFWINLYEKENEDIINKIYGNKFTFTLELYNTFKYSNYEKVKKLLSSKLQKEYFENMVDSLIDYRRKINELMEKETKLKNILNSKSWKLIKILKKILNKSN